MTTTLSNKIPITVKEVMTDLSLLPEEPKPFKEPQKHSLKKGLVNKQADLPRFIDTDNLEDTDEAKEIYIIVHQSIHLADAIKFGAGATICVCAVLILAAALLNNF